MEWGDCVQNIVQKLERQGGAGRRGSTQAMGRPHWKETVNDFSSLIPLQLPMSLNKHWALCSITMSEAYLDYIATPLSFLMAFWFSKDAYFGHNMYPDSHSPLFRFLFLIGSHSTVPADHELVILLPRPERWDYRHVLPLPAHTTILNTSTTEYFWGGKHSVLGARKLTGSLRSTGLEDGVYIHSDQSHQWHRRR